MNGLTLLACAMVALFVGYRFYARWLEKTWGVDPNAKTPAQMKNDGKDYVPSDPSLSNTSDVRGVKCSCSFAGSLPCS